jgi:hypothetical protein
MPESNAATIFGMYHITTDMCNNVILHEMPSLKDTQQRICFLIDQDGKHSCGKYNSQLYKSFNLPLSIIRFSQPLEVMNITGSTKQLGVKIVARA